MSRSFERTDLLTGEWRPIEGDEDFLDAIALSAWGIGGFRIIDEENGGSA